MFLNETFLLGSLRVLREIELARAQRGDVVVDPEGLMIYWALTASKTDPAAKSCAQKLACLCVEVGEVLRPCHLMAIIRI